MSIISPELSSQIATWRLHAAEGTLSQDEMKAIIIQLRAGRMAAADAAQAVTRKKKAAKVEIPSADDMLSEI